MSRTSILQRIIVGAADRLANDPRIPDSSRLAFRETAVHVFEQQVRDVIGYDEVRIRGWSMLPSERRARQTRIVTALKANEEPKTIAAREKVGEPYVRKLRARLNPR